MNQPHKNHQNKFFLISFLPAMAYWYMEENYPLRVAISAGLILAILEIVLEKVFTKHVHKISVFNFFLILFLGLLSLLGDEGIWFKLQPFLTGIFMGGYLLFKCYRGKGLMWEMMETMDRPLPPFEVWAPLEKHLAFFMLFYGIFMAFVATLLSTDLWLFFKTAGFYLCFLLFFVVEMIRLRVRLKAMTHVKTKEGKKF